MPILVKGKQLDIKTVTTSLSTFMNNVSNVTDRNTFVDSIKAAPGFDEKVKADAADTNVPNYLSQKLIGDTTTDPNITTTVAYDNTLKKVKISAAIDINTLTTTIANKFTYIYFAATGTMPTYTNFLLENKTIFYLTREHQFLYAGPDPDDYSFDVLTGIITFNTPVESPERISILFI